jgi:hypothetical protein
MRGLTGAPIVVAAAILGLTGALVGAQAPAAPSGAPAAGAQTAAPPATPPAAAPGTVIGTPANDTAKGATLLAEARKAIGGEDRFKAVQRLEIKGKSARAQQQFNIEGDFEIGIEGPSKFRRKETLGMQDVSVDILQLLDGQTASQKTDMGGAGANLGGFDDGGGRGGGRGGRGGRGNDIARFLGGATSDDPEEQRIAIGTQAARFTMLMLLTSAEPVAWIGVAESPDGRANVLEFKTPDGVANRLLLDEKTHMPLMLTWTGTVQNFQQQRGGGNRGGGGGGGGRGANFPQSQAPNQAQAQQGRQGRGGGGSAPQQAALQMYVSDYKTANGLKFPFLIQSGANNVTTEEMVVKSVRINPSFRADYFTK